MTLEEFKGIYFWEYGHRMMGRMLGVAFVLPMGYFAFKKKIPTSLYPRLVGLLGLGGAQVHVLRCSQWRSNLYLTRVLSGANWVVDGTFRLGG